MNRPPRRRPEDFPANPGRGSRPGGQEPGIQGGAQGGAQRGQRGAGGDDLNKQPFPLPGFFDRQKKPDRPGKFAKYIRPSRRLNVIIFICLVVSFVIWIGWTVSDVTGEYASSGYDRDVVRLSLVRFATNVKCRLSFGSGATLEARVNSIDSSKPLRIVFQTPEKWVTRGRPQRTVILDGKFAGTGMNPLQGSFQENEIRARLIENNEYVTVRLQRNSVTSLWRQVQAHWPWAEI